MSVDVREKIALGSRPPGVPADVMKPVAYQVPTETVSLPSKGLVYPVESSLHQKDNVDVRCMTARDEDILTSRALIKKGTAMSTLISSCLMDKSIDPDELLVGDRNAILVALRVSGYGAKYEVRVECPECSHAFDHEFNLGNLPLRNLGAEPVSPGQNLFRYELEMMKKTVEFRLMTGAAERELTLNAERKKKAVGPGGVEDNITSRLAAQIVSIGGETDRAQIARLVRDMPAGDSRDLRTYIAQIEPLVEMIGEIDCPACSERSEVEMPIGAEFFWPQSRR